MKNSRPAKPTRSQKESIKKAGFSWENWLVVSEDTFMLTIVNKTSGIKKNLLDLSCNKEAIADAAEILAEYYEALAKGDMEKVDQVNTSVSDVEMVSLEKQSLYIENYENISCYTKKGLFKEQD